MTAELQVADRRALRLNIPPGRPSAETGYDAVVSAASRWRDRLTAPLRRLRWAASGWSTDADQRFHDAQFAAVDRDPFTPSYPGYLTIRRFADHAERCFDGVRSVVDLGCGPGEITCELARRRPDVTFLGVDHSDVGVATARAHAARLQIGNATFEVHDLERYQPAAPIDLVVMFDAFHHVLDPSAFLERLRPSCPAFFLIEPAGTWTGGWNRSGDLDWLPETLGQIRQRLEYQFSLEADAPSTPLEAGPVTPGTHAQAALSEVAGPTEYRYTLTDFERLFAGFSLDVRGTIAGLERYGPRPRDRSALRDRVGTLTYELVVSLEQVLFDEGLDLSAKHWAIHARRDQRSPGLTHRVSRRLQSLDSAPGDPRPGLLSPYGVEYSNHTAPTEVTRGETFQFRVRLINRGWLTWESTGGSPVFASYHWLDGRGATIVHDGIRTSFPDAVPPGASADVDLRLTAPETPGRARLAIDLVHEGRTWFSQQGVVPLAIDISVR